MDSSLFAFIIICSIGGIFAGLTSGLLGLGGGIVIVPLLNYMIPHFFHVNDAQVLIVCVTTSFAVIVFNTGMSAFRQIKNRNVNFGAVLKVAPFLVLASILMTHFAPKMNPGYLRIIFGAVLIYSATRMLQSLGKKHQLEESELTEDLSLPKGVVAGSLIGGVSSVAGISGGSFLSPFFLACKFPIKRALGTSSACGFFLATSSCIGYLISGYGIETGIPYSFGYLSIISFLSLFITSVYFASYGVKLQQILPANKVKMIFSLFIYVIALEMLYKGFVSLGVF